MSTNKYQLISFIIATSLLALATLFPPPATAQDRLPIVSKAIAFHGGDLYQASETELDVCSRSGCFHIRALRDGDRFEYEVTGKVRDRQRKVRWTNTSLDVWEDGKPVSVEVGSEERQRFQDWVSARIYFPFLPYRLNDSSVHQADLGLETWDGKKLHKVKITFAAGSSTDASDEYLYWFDPESGRVEQFAYSFEGNPGGLRFRRPRDYRRIDGLLFFDQENLGIGGDDLSVDQITPSFVSEKMSPVSVVRFEKIEVHPTH